jgi:hypothetical protein
MLQQVSVVVKLKARVKVRVSVVTRLLLPLPLASQCRMMETTPLPPPGLAVTGRSPMTVVD